MSNGMFMYDDGVMVEVLWEKLQQEIRTNVELRSELEVATRAVTNLQSQIPVEEPEDTEAEDTETDSSATD